MLSSLMLLVLPINRQVRVTCMDRAQGHSNVCGDESEIFIALVSNSISTALGSQSTSLHVTWLFQRPISRVSEIKVEHYYSFNLLMGPLNVLGDVCVSIVT